MTEREDMLMKALRPFALYSVSNPWVGTIYEDSWQRIAFGSNDTPMCIDKGSGTKVMQSDFLRAQKTYEFCRDGA